MIADIKIRLLKELPVDLAHGCVKGREFEAQYKHTVIGEDGEKVVQLKEGIPVEFAGDTGDLCVAFEHEYEII